MSPRLTTETRRERRNVEVSACTLCLRRELIGYPKVWGRQDASHGVCVEFGLTLTVTAVVGFTQRGDSGSEARYETVKNALARCHPHDRSM